MKTITDELLEKMLDYIKMMEKLYEGEFGSNREWEEMLEDGDVPELYHKLKAIQDGE